MASMDEEILVIAAPSLRQDLHASSADLQLVLVMYTIAFAALVVIGAQLGDVVGRRRTRPQPGRAGRRARRTGRVGGRDDAAGALDHPVPVRGRGTSSRHRC